MIVNYRYRKDTGRLGLQFTPERFDGDPGLRELFFDGINEPLSGDTLGLAAWMLLGRFVSRRMQLPEPVTLPLADQIGKEWGGALELLPIDDEPARFPPRLGSMVVNSSGDSSGAPADEGATRPVYRLTILPAGASGTSYTAGNVQAKTNVLLLGQGANGPGCGGTLATAILYADFLGVSDLVVDKAAIDTHPPAKLRMEKGGYAAWRDLLKHAGFDLRVVSEAS